MPSGGSPQNLNVEFLPGLVRTRGGLQPWLNIGGQFQTLQVRSVTDYATAPESPSQLALLANPTASPGAIVVALNQIVNGSLESPTEIGNISGYGNAAAWAPGTVNPAFGGPLAKWRTEFGRKWAAISDGRYGYDMPRHYDGANFDRVSQCGPGAAPQVQDLNLGALAIAASPNGLVPVVLTIAASPAGLVQNPDGTVTLNASGLPIGATLLANDQVVVAGAGVSGYDGNFLVARPAGAGRTVLIPQFTMTPGLAASGGGTATTSLVSVNAPLPEFSLPPIVFPVGFKGTIAGAGVSGYNTAAYFRQGPRIKPGGGTQPAVFYIPGAYLLAASGGGTLTMGGHITAGLHQLSVCFITRKAYITKPAPPFSWTAGGNLPALVTNIPIGPANVIARLLIATPVLTPPAVTGTFYAIRGQATVNSQVMQIPDNFSTSWVLDFTDSDITMGFNAQYLFNLHELQECGGVFSYGSRMFWWGELGSIDNLLNCEFNGGWSHLNQLAGNGSTGAVPLGWDLDVGTSVGAGTINPGGGLFGDAYEIFGTGVAGNMGAIQQPAYQDWLSEPIILPNTPYGVRIMATSQSLQDTLVVQLFSPTQGVIGQAMWTNQAPGSIWQMVVLPLNNALLTVVPSDLVVKLFSPNLANGHSIQVDRIMLFPMSQSVNYTTVRASYASDPESFDAVTGLLQPAYSNGEAVRAAYTLRDSLYFALDRSTYVTKAIAGSEPASWPVDPVSASIGSTGPTAVAAGEDWEIKINRYGAYIYIGREPEKISQEIQGLWNKEGLSNLINWAAAYKIWVAVDLLNKRVYIGAPVGPATECNTLFVMDFNTLDTSEMIAEYPTLRFSPYTGRRVILEQGRKWTIWQFQPPPGANVPAGSNGLLPLPCGAYVEIGGGQARFLMGGAVDSNIYLIDPTKRGNDNGVATTSTYVQHFFPTQDEQQGLQLRAHMHGFSFGRLFVQGFGALLLSLYRNSLADAQPKTRVLQLANPALRDNEQQFDEFTAERYALGWTMSQLNGWFQVERVTRVVETDPNALIRGSNLQ